MKIILDEKACLKKKLTLQEALIAAAVSMGNFKGTFDNLINRQVLGITGQSINSEWENIIKGLIGSDEECFPKQKMVNNYGQESPFYFRCNKTEIKNKLKKFLEVYGEVSDEDIIDATKRYVNSYAPKGYRGMRLAKYFILKDDRKLSADDEVHVEQLSDLATFLENKTEEKAEDIVDGDDWLMNSRN